MNTVNSIDVTEDLMTLVPQLYKMLLHDRGRPDSFLLPPTHIRALLALMQHGTLNMTQIAACMEVRRQQLTKIMDTLAEKGYILRTEDPRNRRLILNVISDRGRLFIEGLIQEKARRFTNYFQGLSKEDQHALLRSILILKAFCFEQKEAHDIVGEQQEMDRI